MRTMIKRWLCDHKKTIWVNTTAITIRTLQHTSPRTLSAKSVYLCEECGKFIKTKNDAFNQPLAE